MSKISSHVNCQCSLQSFLLTVRGHVGFETIDQMFNCIHKCISESPRQKIALVMDMNQTHASDRHAPSYFIKELKRFKEALCCVAIVASDWGTSRKFLFSVLKNLFPISTQHFDLIPDAFPWIEKLKGD